MRHRVRDAIQVDDLKSDAKRSGFALPVEFRVDAIGNDVNQFGRSQNAEQRTHFGVLESVRQEKGSISDCQNDHGRSSVGHTEALPRAVSILPQYSKAAAGLASGATLASPVPVRYPSLCHSSSVRLASCSAA